MTSNADELKLKTSEIICKGCDYHLIAKQTFVNGYESEVCQCEHCGYINTNWTLKGNIERNLDD